MNKKALSKATYTLNMVRIVCIMTNKSQYGKIMSESIAKKWLESAILSAKNKDHKSHKDLISKKVSLQGVPGFESIGYDDWSAQTKHEFQNKILKNIKYTGYKSLSSTLSHIMFKTFETVEAHDGTINAQGVEMLLEKESDGQWRLIQERVLPADETAHDGLAPAP